jgi:2-polyprenyl-3-methyl-5-hydroxy-6-metoxy-1,4-benzoquinol methylase
MTFVDKNLFVEGHYLGKPAEFTDRIILKRIALTEQIKDFCGQDLTLADVGCGNGASMFLLAKKMKKCVGIEVFSTHQQAFEQMQQTLQATNCEFAVFDIEKEKYPEQFDRIICFEVIEHLADERNVKALYDMLNDGGKAAISVPNKWWIFETHGAKLPLLPWNRVPFFSWLPRPIHEKFANARIYTKSRITQLLQSVGFIIEDVTYITAPLDVLKDGKLKDWLLQHIFTGNTTQIPFLSTSIFISVKKIGH